jgi:hypothetical protein
VGSEEGVQFMKRDMDLLRAILLEVEQQHVNEPWSAMPLMGYSLEEVVYHIQLAHDSGLVDARIAPGAHHAVVIRLTHEGHEFLDAARNDNIWSKAKAMAKSATGAITLEALKAALPKIIEQLMRQI